jgi:hypothetical protein
MRLRIASVSRHRTGRKMHTKLLKENLKQRDYLGQCGSTRGPRTHLFWPSSHTPILVPSNFFKLKVLLFNSCHGHYFCILLAARHIYCIIQIGPASHKRLDHTDLGDLNVDGMLILKWILRK